MHRDTVRTQVGKKGREHLGHAAPYRGGVHVPERTPGEHVAQARDRRFELTDEPIVQHASEAIPRVRGYRLLEHGGNRSRAVARQNRKYRVRSARVGLSMTAKFWSKSSVATLDRE